MLKDLAILRGRTGYRTGSKIPQLCPPQYTVGPLTIQSITLYSVGEQDGRCQKPKHQKHWGLKKLLRKDASVDYSEKVWIYPYSLIPLKS